MSEQIVIAEYDPLWIDQYQAERDHILNAIGVFVTSIEHIGSTSVIGLAAKPIIDIMVGLNTLSEAGQCIEPVESLGYDYVPKFEDEMPERRYFPKDTDGIRSHQIHMVEYESPFWKRHLLFRNILRSHLNISKEYELLFTLKFVTAAEVVPLCQYQFYFFIYKTDKK